MDKIRWIKELVLAEQRMEESGMVELSSISKDSEALLREETAEFLQQVKTAFIEAASAFNQLKGSPIGTLKIYGISKTEADFMLFRNGSKLIFSAKSPGVIQVYRNQINTHFAPGASPSDIQTSEHCDLLQASWGAFGDLEWTHDQRPIRIDFLIRHYLTQFVNESSK